MDYEKKYKSLVKAVKELQEANPSDEGIQAWVNDNVPELKESEDEMIRKELIQFFSDKDEEDYEGLHPRVKILAWLKKQGEHARFREAIQVGDQVTKNEDGVLVNLSQLKRVAKPSEQNQGEQKPKFRVGDTIRLKNSNAEYIIESISDSHYYGKGFSISIVGGNRDYELVEQKPAWSEEDEELLRDVSDTYFYNDEDYPEETYKQMLKRVLDWMNKRAKSFRSQNTWKPSEEQITVLHDVAAYIDNSIYPNQKDILVNLYLQLKKLRNE